MKRLLFSRVLGAVGVLVVLLTIVFFLRTVVPADAVKVRLGGNASAAAVAAERHRLGLDRPLVVQYVDYLSGLVHGDLGPALHTHRSVRADLADFLPATLELASVAGFVAVAGGLVLGVVGALAPRGEGWLRLLFVCGASAPSFFVALLLVELLYNRLGLLPATGRTSLTDAPYGPTPFLVVNGLLKGRLDVVGDALTHLTLPVTCLAIGPAVAIGRVLRASLLETYGADFVRAARARGLHPWRVLWGHALRPSLGAPLTMVGLQAGLLLSGVVVVETVFGWPGIGLYTLQAIQTGDVNAVIGVTLVLGVAYIVVNLAVDVAQALADPRVRLGV